MKQLHMCCMVDLPDDLFSAADTTSKVKPAWEALLKALKESALIHDAKITIEETRGPVRQQRKPLPKITIVNPPEGATFQC